MNEAREKYIGKHLLIGLTYLNMDDSIKERVQLHGIISEISSNTISFIRADNDELFSIPFDEDNLEPSEPEAVYELNGTGEVVVEVDFISTWTIHPPTGENSQL